MNPQIVPYDMRILPSFKQTASVTPIRPIPSIFIGYSTSILITNCV